MSKLYDKIEEVIKHDRDASYLGEIIWKIAIKAQIELLEETNKGLESDILLLFLQRNFDPEKIKGQREGVEVAIERNAIKIQELQKQLEA